MLIFISCVSNLLLFFSVNWTTPAGLKKSVPMNSIKSFEAFLMPIFGSEGLCFFKLNDFKRFKFSHKKSLLWRRKPRRLFCFHYFLSYIHMGSYRCTYQLYFIFNTLDGLSSQILYKTIYYNWVYLKKFPTKCQT